MASFTFDSGFPETRSQDEGWTKESAETCVLMTTECRYIEAADG